MAIDYVASIQEGAQDTIDLDIDDPKNDAISQASSDEDDEMDYVQGYVYSNGYPEGRSGMSFPRREKRKFFRSSLKFHTFQDIRLPGEHENWKFLIFFWMGVFKEMIYL